jgi:hypothetical protein
VIVFAPANVATVAIVVYLSGESWYRYADMNKVQVLLHLIGTLARLTYQQTIIENRCEPSSLFYYAPIQWSDVDQKQRVPMFCQPFNNRVK